jgi:DNA-directed RNA polymerase specialized sigma24 family protein
MPEKPLPIPSFWVQLRRQLTHFAQKSGLPSMEVEDAVHETLFRLLKTWQVGGPPDFPLRWAFVTLGRILGSLRIQRNRLEAFSEKVSCKPFTRDIGIPAKAPGLCDFWEWVDEYGEVLERKLTALQIDAVLATKNAETFSEAAHRAGLSQRDLRNHLFRAAKKIQRILQGFAMTTEKNDPVSSNKFSSEKKAQEKAKPPADSIEKGASRRISRREVMKQVGLGFGFLCFPALGGRKGNIASIPPPKHPFRQGQFFDSCTHGGQEYNQYSDGSDCDSFDCSNDFLCEGGWWDDFECASRFDCGTENQQNQFRCVWSYDDEDCETAFHCDWFNCEAGYTADPNSLGREDRPS